MPGLLDILLHNESGGRNVANTTSGTDSGQAQGYFQITTGTWDDFGGRAYAPRPLDASYEQQAMIASKLPLKRWAPSTVAALQATGKPIDVNKTLGENLSANGENILRTTGASYTSSAPISTTLMPPSGTDASAFAYLNNNDYHDVVDPVSPPPQYSDLSSTLADSVDTSAGSQRQQSSGPIGYNDLYGVPEGGAGDTLPPSALGSQQGSEGQAPSATAPSTEESLADLFKVKPIGQAAMVDPKTGQPLLNRYRALG